jgi:predicted AlkP superfamily pyrophosphatase or phosphodiesterase
MLQLFFAGFLLLTAASSLQAKKKERSVPTVTIVIVGDQFANNYLPKLKPHLQYAFKHLLKNGVVYTDAHHPHGVPETTPGHHAISTGTLPKYHGAIFNSWVDDKYKEVRYETDRSGNAAVLNEVSGADGISAHHTKVDGLSDQFMKMADKSSEYAAYAFSLKKHPVVSCANRLGKAFWFDASLPGFTSSKAFFEKLPDWTVRFNKKNAARLKKPFKWHTAYPLESAAYQFPGAREYKYAGASCSMILGKSKDFAEAKLPWQDLLLRSPAGADALFSFTKKAIKNLVKQGKTKLLLWVSLSNLDFCGHIYGPDSLECIDIVYHLDKQISDFMSYTDKLFGKKNVLYVFTADHGICPIPEITAQKGYNLARRIDAPTLIKEMNSMVAEKYKLIDFVKVYEPTFFVLDKKALLALSAEKRFHVLHDLKTYLLKQPGIKKVWTRDELAQLSFEASELEQFYKNHLYKDRNGDLIVMTEPYCLLTNYPKGTSHSSPYGYDTHVPLILYQAGSIQKKVIVEKVWLPQLPVTIASILHMGKPSAATYPVLPNIV